LVSNKNAKIFTDAIGSSSKTKIVQLEHCSLYGKSDIKLQIIDTPGLFDGEILLRDWKLDLETKIVDKQVYYLFI
jgi:hypothetical protein